MNNLQAASLVSREFQEKVFRNLNTSPSKKKQFVYGNNEVQLYKALHKNYERTKETPIKCSLRNAPGAGKTTIDLNYKF